MTDIPGRATPLGGAFNISLANLPTLGSTRAHPQHTHSTQSQISAQHPHGFGSSTSHQPNVQHQAQQVLSDSQQRPHKDLEEISKDKICEWVAQLVYGPNQDQALFELGKKREQYEDLALVLWNSYGVMTVLLQEIISVYPFLSPPHLTMQTSNRVCNALALLQCVASHDSTRNQFLKAHIPLFLYPFLNTTSKVKPFEYLRLTSLGVIGALVKNDSTEVVNFLLSTEIIPLCLRIIETGTELSKTVAIFIVQKIIMDDLGLNYVCQTYERFFAVSAVLANVVQQLVATQPASSRLLKHVVRCYLRLSDDPRARESLRQILPEALRNATFNVILKGDASTKRCLAQLLANISAAPEAQP